MALYSSHTGVFKPAALSLGTNSITATWNEKECVWTKGVTCRFDVLQPATLDLEGVASFQGNLISRIGSSGLIWLPLGTKVT